jgi:hypothetical protein
MAEALDQPPVTATVGFDQAAHNELAAAALTADRYHTRHHTAVVEPCLDDVLDPIVAALMNRSRTRLPFPLTTSARLPASM